MQKRQTGSACRYMLKCCYNILIAMDGFMSGDSDIVIMNFGKGT
jgi:hypothetical protein